MNAERLLDRFLRLVQIPSPSGKETAVAEHIKKWADGLGLAYWTDRAGSHFGGECGNLVIRVPGVLPESCFLSAHMDVVEPCTTVRPILKDGWVTTDGCTVLGADAKAGVAAMLETAETLLESKRRGPGTLELVLTVGEELGLHGARALDIDRLEGRFGWVIDSQSPLGTMIGAAPYEEVFDATVWGRAAHAGVEPEKGVHAGLAAAEAMASVSWGRLSADTTANVGRFEGGLATNVVMPSARFDGEIRSHRESALEAQKQALKNALEAAALKRGAKFDLKFRRNYDAYKFDASHPLARRFKAASEALGLPFRMRLTNGGSDANIFNAQGRPAVNIGYGATGIHTCEERIKISDLELLAKLVLSLTRPSKQSASIGPSPRASVLTV